VLSSDRRCRNPASSSYCYKQREQVSQTRFVQKQKLGLHVVDKFRVTNFQRRWFSFRNLNWIPIPILFQLDWA
jgi:hypothetical protein